MLEKKRLRKNILLMVKFSVLLRSIGFGLNFISFVYQHMSNDIYKQAYMIYKTGFRRKSVDLFESVSHRLSSVSDQPVWYAGCVGICPK